MVRAAPGSEGRVRRDWRTPPARLAAPGDPGRVQREIETRHRHAARGQHAQEQPAAAAHVQNDAGFSGGLDGALHEAEVVPQHEPPIDLSQPVGAFARWRRTNNWAGSTPPAPPAPAAGTDGSGGSAGTRRSGICLLGGPVEPVAGGEQWNKQRAAAGRAGLPLIRFHTACSVRVRRGILQRSVHSLTSAVAARNFFPYWRSGSPKRTL